LILDAAGSLAVYRPAPVLCSARYIASYDRVTSAPGKTRAPDQGAVSEAKMRAVAPVERPETHRSAPDLCTRQLSPKTTLSAELGKVAPLRFTLTATS
jgi:hypothetical protein